MDKTLSNQDGPTTPQREQVGSNALFAVGEVFTFIGDGHRVRWKVVSCADGYVRFGEPSGGRLTGPMLVSADRLMIGMSEDRARRVDSANSQAQPREASS